MTGDVEEARDCVQEAFARAWLRWDGLARAHDPVAWVYTVSYRIAVSRFRRTMVHRRMVGRLAAGDRDAALPGPSPDAIAATTCAVAGIVALTQLVRSGATSGPAPAATDSSAACCTPPTSAPAGGPRGPRPRTATCRSGAPAS